MVSLPTHANTRATPQNGYESRAVIVTAMPIPSKKAIASVTCWYQGHVQSVSFLVISHRSRLGSPCIWRGCLSAPKWYYPGRSEI